VTEKRNPHLIQAELIVPVALLLLPTIGWSNRSVESRSSEVGANADWVFKKAHLVQAELDLPLNALLLLQLIQVLLPRHAARLELDDLRQSVENPEQIIRVASKCQSRLVQVLLPRHAARLELDDLRQVTDNQTR